MIRSLINPLFCYLGNALSQSLLPAWEKTVSAADTAFELALFDIIQDIEKGCTLNMQMNIDHARYLLTPCDAPRLSSGLHKLAKVYYMLGDVQTALSKIREALLSCHTWQINDRPDRQPFRDNYIYFVKDYFPSEQILPILYTYSILLIENHHFNEAIEALEIIKEFYGARNELSSFANTLNDIGIAYYQSGNFHKAKASIINAIRLQQITGNNENVKKAIDNLNGCSYVFNQENKSDFDFSIMWQFKAPVEISGSGEPNEIGMPFKDIKIARHILEQALISQFRTLSNCLLADMLLRGEEVPNIIWWRHYMYTMPANKGVTPDFNAQSFHLFRKQFIRAVALKKINRISRSQLYNQTIEVYGETVKCWEEGKINRQLAALGSSVRLIVVGSNVFRQYSMKQYIRKNICKDDQASAFPTDDGKFILGEIGPVSAFKMASFYDFKKEYAIAPYFSHRIDGFSESSHGRIVAMRQVTDDAETIPRNANGFHNIRFTFNYGTLVHEYFHFEHSIGEGNTDILSSWRDVLREDLCRLTTEACSRDEIMSTFRRIYNSSIDYRYFAQIRNLDDNPLINEDIQDLYKKQLLIEIEPNKFECALFNEIKLWNL